MHALSPDQTAALDLFAKFLDDPDARVFVLSGPAGTGKTTLLRSMIEAVEARRSRWQLTALTGRAASIARARSGHGASTLHAFLYRFDSRASKIVNGEPRLVFSLRDSDRDGTGVLFVDEASMLGRAGQSESDPIRYGSGVLVVDLLRFLFERAGVDARLPKVVLVGDPYQLPPVGESNSIAFDDRAWTAIMDQVLGPSPETVRVALSTVHRQARGGAILELATRYRALLETDDYRSTPKYPSDEDGVSLIASGDAFTGLPGRVAAEPESTAIIAHTNEAALSWNRLVRDARWGSPDEPLQPGDLLLNTRRDPRTGLENGEVLVVESRETVLHSVRHLGRTLSLRPVGLRRATDDAIHETLLLESSLTDSGRGLDRVDQQVLWIDFRERHPGLRESTPEFWELAYRDPVLNPIIAKYGYAMTCHKAQGGQWTNVIVDYPSYAQAHDSEEAFRWAYTAVTRARHELILVDPPRRSPYSRLASPPSAGESSATLDRDPALPQAPGDRRARAEAAVEAWSQAQGIDTSRVQTSDYSIRFRASRAIDSIEYDVHFKGDGDVSNVIPVRSGAAPSELIPPVHIPRRAAFEGAARPADDRIDVALTAIEQHLRAGELEVTLRATKDWSVELEVGAGADSGILLLDYRKSGVFSSSRWRHKPSSDIEVRVAHCMDAIADA